MEEQIYKIKRLYFTEDRTSGSIWRIDNYGNGSLNVLCGCYFDKSIAEHARLLLPGDVIRLTDTKMTKKIGRGEREFEYIIIWDFEPVHLIDGRSI